MRTVKNMIEELKKFPEDAMCYAYEGECCGLGIKHGNKYGFIPASEGGENDMSYETEILEPLTFYFNGEAVEVKE